MITSSSTARPGAPTTSWRRWPGHVVAHRPPCSTPGCKRPAMRWTACACGAPFALCGECPGSPLVLRGEHATTCPAAIARGGYTSAGQVP